MWFLDSHYVLSITLVFKIPASAALAEMLNVRKSPNLEVTPRSCNWSRPASPIEKSVIGSESVKTPYSASSNVTVLAAPKPPNDQIDKPA